MAETAAAAIGGLVSTFPNNASDAPTSLAIPDLQAKYALEREKRLRSDGSTQFVELGKSKDFQYLAEDPWVDHAKLNAQTPPLKDGDSVKFLTLGAGYGGLLFAVKLVMAGFKPEQIRLVDSAGGFGGTWYWNRYPGLMCDTESYIYMPLLEETGHIPQHRYTYGPELRAYANEIAEKWDLTDKALFRTEAKSMDWDDEKKHWAVKMTENRGPGEQKRDLTVYAQFVTATTGLLNFPQIPKLPGIDKFTGHHFHTSRWDYRYTGGEPGAIVELVNLKDKRVALLGTGATAVQAMPQLAKWSKELYVFQRTPSSVDVRNQHPTDISKWTQQVAFKKGWQRDRMLNFNSILSRAPDGPNLVNDSWCNIPTYGALVGGPWRGIVPVEKIPEDVANINAMDVERSNRVRARVEEVVQDKQTAENLKAWYPSWCKRPTFHDDYLQAFNQPNVKLVDTDGKGIDCVTEKGVVSGGQEYPVDLIILGTGYRGPADGSGSAAHRANMVVRGRGGKNMEDKWAEGIATLHGVLSRDFPNFFLPGPSQTGAAANQMFVLDQMSTHAAYIASAAAKKAKADGDKFMVEPTHEAEEMWSMRVMQGAGNFAAIAGCTPSYLNREGEAGRQLDLEAQMKAARGSIWPEGANAFVKIIEEWREKGDLDGLEVRS